MRRALVFGLLLVVHCSNNSSPVDAGVDAAPDAVEYPAAPPPPDGGYPSCGPKLIAEAGPCCENFFCIDVREAGACPLASSSEVTTSWEVAFGSCSCGAATGPYESPDGSIETCCYISHSQFCQ